MAILGMLLALGMSSAAFILGVQAKKAASGTQAITVKGLAVKNIKADNAEWTVTVSVTQPTFADALNKLRAERPTLDAFLIKEGWIRLHGKRAASRLQPIWKPFICPKVARKVNNVDMTPANP